MFVAVLVNVPQHFFIEFESESALTPKFQV